MSSGAPTTPGAALEKSIVFFERRSWLFSVAAETSVVFLQGQHVHRFQCRPDPDGCAEAERNAFHAVWKDECRFNLDCRIAGILDYGRDTCRSLCPAQGIRRKEAPDADLRLRYATARNRSADQRETKCGACQRTVKHVIVHLLSLGAVHVNPLDGQ